jgi:hypothetical protein
MRWRYIDLRGKVHHDSLPKAVVPISILQAVSRLLSQRNELSCPSALLTCCVSECWRLDSCSSSCAPQRKLDSFTSASSSLLSVPRGMVIPERASRRYEISERRGCDKSTLNNAVIPLCCRPFRLCVVCRSRNRMSRHL